MKLTSLIVVPVVAMCLIFSDSRAQTPEPSGRDSRAMEPLPCGRATVFAQVTPDEQDSDAGRGRGRLRRQMQQQMYQQQKHIEQFRMFELLKLMDLDEDQEIAFLTAYKHMRQEHEGIEQVRQEALTRLQEALRAEPIPEDVIETHVQRVLTLKRDKEELLDRFVDELGGFLTTAQVGRFVLFQERFEFELLKQLRGFHNRHEGNNQP